VATLVVLVSEEIPLDSGVLSALARLGVSHVAVVRDEETVGVVLDGWAFDPEASAAAAVAAVAGARHTRTLRPVAQLAVAAAPPQGGLR
jgi:hypothetical protein